MENEGGLSTRSLVTHGLTVAFVAAFLQQVVHEATHGIVAMMVGKQWVFFNLFATGSRWLDAPSARADAVIAGSAALFNIVCGTVCVFLFARPRWHQCPTGRLFLLYFGGFSLLSGFGYLMFDSLFFNPASNSLGDWRRVVAFLGGGWAVRAPILLIGAAGSLATFFWLPYAALRFGDGSIDSPSRVRIALPLLLIPYIVISALFTTLAFWHPLGAMGTVVVGLKYWLGYIGFFWAFFIAAYWADFREPISGLSRLPQRVATPWLVAALGALAAAVVLVSFTP